MSDVEKVVRDFYDRFGWVEEESGATGEDVLFRRFSPAYYPYHEAVNARTMECFSGLSGKLLMAGGGDLPETHIEIARRFSTTTFLDISSKALEIARSKFKQEAEFVNESLLNIPLPEDHFDAAYCAHVIYHIDKDLQEKAVREMIRVTRPGGRIVIIYRNPASLPQRIGHVRRKLSRMLGIRRLSNMLKQRKHETPGSKQERPRLYFYAHPLDWWNRFQNECDVRLIPWDVMTNTEDSELLMNGALARIGYRFCGWLERKHPNKAVQWWSYPVAVMTKKQARTANSSTRA